MSSRFVNLIEDHYLFSLSKSDGGLLINFWVSVKVEEVTCLSLTSTNNLGLYNRWDEFSILNSGCLI